MTHTQGPWVVEPITNEEEAYGVYASAENAFVAVTPWGPNTEENAHLIAAAPDLLAALQYLLAQTIEADEDASIGLTEGEEEAAQMARAAISKAKGN